MLKAIIWVGLGGGLGSISRYIATLTMNKFFHGEFPMATLVVNLTGSFIIGVLLARFSELPDEQLRLLWIVGFCGGFTTFSTFSAENIHLIQNGQFILALINIFGSVILGLLAVLLGFLLVNKLGLN